MYGISRKVPYTFDQALDRVTDALKAEGFGVLTTIDVKETLKKKIDVNFKDYVILGTCNPQLAYQALEAEEEIGLLLPCNVIVYQGEDGTRVSVLNPLEAMGIVNNEQVESVAEQAEEKLRRAIESV